MIFLDRVEHHTYINVCVELGKSLLEIKQLLEKTQRGSSVSRALVNRWHIHVKKIPRPHLIEAQINIVRQLTIASITRCSKQQCKTANPFINN